MSTLDRLRGHENPDVIIVGAGPVGLWLAAELRLGGATVLVIEKRATRTTYSRALTTHARTLEILASRGILDQWLAEGVRIPSTHFAMLPDRLDLSVVDTDFPFALFLPQVRTEELLEQHAIDVGARVVRKAEVTKLAEEADRVRVTVSTDDGAIEVESRFVVGCDGRRSIVRESAGIAYEGSDDVLTGFGGDVLVDSSQLCEPSIALRTERGSFFGVRIDGDRYRLIGIEHVTMATRRDQPLTFDELRKSITNLVGTDFGMSDPTWLTRVGSATFQADDYRRGRVLLAGDAAHVHFPMGGVGMNLGIEDATNLGWKLAAHLRSVSPDGLLDTYHLERHPAGEVVIEAVRAQTAIVAAAGPEGHALRGLMSTALGEANLNRQLARRVAGLASRYSAITDNTDHPLVGERVRNLPLADGIDTSTLLRHGRFVVVGLQVEAVEAAFGSALREEVVVNACPFLAPPGPWDDVAAALIRPDGYLAWASTEVSENTHAAAARALSRWLAPPSAPKPKTALAQSFTT